MKKLVLYSIAAALALLLTASTFFAQSIKSKTQRFVSSGGGYGNFVMNEGELISRDGVIVPFGLYENDEGDVEGFRISKAGIMEVKPGDVIPLHVVGIKIMGSYPKWYDNNGKRLRTDDFGGWRNVALKSVKESGQLFSILFDDEIMIADGRLIKQLDYDVKGDTLIPAHIAKHPAGSPERYLVRKDKSFKINGTLTSSWGVGEVVTKNGAAVRFEALAKDDKSFGGYKFVHADLKSLGKNDQVLIYFEGIKHAGDWQKGFFDASGEKVRLAFSGGWRVVTIAGITSSKDRIMLKFKDNIELENGTKVNSIEFEKVDKWAMPVSS